MGQGTAAGAVKISAEVSLQTLSLGVVLPSVDALKINSARGEAKANEQEALAVSVSPPDALVGRVGETKVHAGAPAALSEASPARLKKLSPAKRSLRLNHLFDGAGENKYSTPEPSKRRVLAEDVLRRGESRKIALSRVGETIARSKNEADARAGLEKIGLLEGAEGTESENVFRYLLGRLWYHASQALPLGHELDESWPVAAVVVRRGKKTFYLHGVVHGAGLPANGFAVRKTVSDIKRRGRALFSEEMFPSSYGYAFGSEILLSPVKKGGEVSVRKGAWSVKHSVFWTLRAAIPAATFALPFYLALTDPVNYWAWAALAALAAVFQLIWTSFFPLFKWMFRATAREAETTLGDPNMGRHYRSLAETMFASDFNFREFLRHELPVFLKEESDPDGALRTERMANAILAGAGAHSDIHVLTGVNNVTGLASRLGR
jgi:hypothetical protein